MDQISASELEGLQRLDPGLMYIFVAGPGHGEAVVVAMALSHPHQDHVEGFAELLEIFEPRHVVVSADPYSEDEDRQNRVAAKNALSWSEQVSSIRVRTALKAIRDWQASGTGQLLTVTDGHSIPVTGERVSVSIRAPSQAALQGAFGNGFSASRANEASLVIELHYGQSVFLLGGDLPWKRNETVLSNGWQLVMSLHPHLAQHHGLKVPHHGSTEALCLDLIRPSQWRRFWCVTPFNSNRLPSTDPRCGIAKLLEAEPVVHLTALAARIRHQRACSPPARVQLGELVARTDAVRTGNPFIDTAVDLREEYARGPLDPVWCCAMDDRGQVVGLWRGRAALEVVQVSDTGT